MATVEHDSSRSRLGYAETQGLGGIMLADEASPPSTTIVYDPGLVRRVAGLSTSETITRRMILAHSTRARN